MTDKEQKEIVKCEDKDDCPPDPREPIKEKFSQSLYKSRAKTAFNNNLEKINDITVNLDNLRQSIEGLGSEIMFSSEEKKILYSKIIEHLDNLWQEGKNSVEYVKDNIFRDIDVITKDAGIIITDKVRHQIEYKITIIFSAKYRYSEFSERLKSLKSKNLEGFNANAREILKIKDELKSTIGKDLLQLHYEIEKKLKNLLPKEKKLVSCRPVSEQYLNPIEIEREIENNKRVSLTVQKNKHFECDQSRLSSNAVADNVDIFAINRDVEMFLTQRIQISYSDLLFEICRLAKRLRNRAVFVGRQAHFFRTRKNYADLSKRYPDLANRILAFIENKLDDPDLANQLKRKFENPTLDLSEKVRKLLGKFEQFASLNEFLKFESVYIDLGAIYSSLPQQVLKYVAASWSSYYEGHASWVKNPRLFEAEPRIPSTKRKEKEFLISFPAGAAKTAFTNLKTQIEHYNATKQSTRRSEKRKSSRYKTSGELLLPSTFLKNFISFPKIRTTIDLKSIVEVRIVPKKCCYELQIVYKIPKTLNNLDNKRAYSIDIGVNTLIALTNNFGEHPILVRGRPIKAINQWMNKKIGALRSVQTQGITFEKGDELSETMEMNRIRRKRNNVVNDYFHKASRFVIDRCLNSRAKNLAIGYNTGWKKIY